MIGDRIRTLVRRRRIVGMFQRGRQGAVRVLSTEPQTPPSKPRSRVIKELNDDIERLSEELDAFFEKEAQATWEFTTYGTVSDFWVSLNSDKGSTEHGFSQPVPDVYDSTYEAYEIPSEFENDTEINELVWSLNLLEVVDTFKYDIVRDHEEQLGGQ